MAWAMLFGRLRQVVAPAPAPVHLALVPAPAPVDAPLPITLPPLPEPAPVATPVASLELDVPVVTPLAAPEEAAQEALEAVEPVVRPAAPAALAPTRRAPKVAIVAAPVGRDQLVVAVSRLSIRISRELGGQVECDRLELELAALQLQLDAFPVEAGPRAR